MFTKASDWNIFLCPAGIFSSDTCQLSLLPFCSVTPEDLAGSYLWPSPFGGRKLLSDCAASSSRSLAFCSGNKPAPLSFSWTFFLILQPAHCHGGSLLDSLQVVSISFLVGGREWPENQTQYSRWVCMSAEHYNHSSQPTAFTLANAAWDGVNFHCRESCCWFMSHLLSVRTSASFLAVVVLASYYTTSAKGWSGFVPDIGPWCLPWLCFIKFLVYFSSL